MKTLHSTAVARALSYLQTGMDLKRWQQGTRLPTIRRLARDAGVGNRAMHSAVRTFARKGALSIVRNRGIYAGERTPVFSTIPEVTMRWQRVKELLYKDMVLGAFEDREILPSSRQLRKIIH